MQNTFDKTNSALKLATILVATILVTGCITSAKNNPTTEAIPATPATPVKVAAVEVAPLEVAPLEVAPEVEAQETEVVEPVEEVVVVDDRITSWTVVKGDNLWFIAGSQAIYNESEKWPLIYQANRDQITDPDLIYPGQVLVIPKDTE